MADLPELDASTKRKLALQWSNLLEANQLTGEHLRWRQEERERLQRVAAQSAPGRPGLDRGTAGDEIGIHPSVEVARCRFNDLVAEYWPLWSSSRDGQESLVDWLELIRQQVSAEIASIWADGSKAIVRWYDRACGPAVGRTLAVQVKERIARARGEELKRFNARAKTKTDAEKAEGQPTPTAETDAVVTCLPTDLQTQNRDHRALRKGDSPKELVAAARRRRGNSNEKFASLIGISRDTLHAVTAETRWVSNETYDLVAQVCNCTPEDLHPQKLPLPKRRKP